MVAAAIAILILAIGIGANTAVFSLVRPVLLKPLPFDDAPSLVWIANTGTAGLSGRTFQVVDLRSAQRASRNRSATGPRISRSSATATTR